MRVKAPSDKNFRRARVKPGRRQSGRPWLSWRILRVVLAAAIVAYGVYRGCALVLDARVLQVSRVVVSGNVHLSTGEVQQLVHGLVGAHILMADLATHRRALLDSPWVADAALRRVLPSTIEVAVVERRPFGISRLGTRLFLVDRQGTIIDEFGPQYAEYDLPIIDGLLRRPKNGKPVIDPARAQLAAEVIDSVSSSERLASRLSQIDVNDVHNAVVLLDDDPALLYLGEERFRERLQAYVDVAETLRERGAPDIDYVDLRFGQRVFMKPRRGTTGTSGKAGRRR
jgi:cell division septal protein FtsQ